MGVGQRPKANSDGQPPGIITAVMVALAIGLASAAGCHWTGELTQPPVMTPVNMVQRGLDQPGGIRRIALMPLENRTMDGPASRQVKELLLAELRDAGQFEVIDTAPWSDPPYTLEQVVRGEFSERLLVDLYYHHNADAMMIVSLNEYRAYDPLSVALTIHVVDTWTAEVLASLDGRWNAANPGTQYAYKDFVRRQVPDVYQQPLYLQSQRAFSQFAVSEAVAHLLGKSLYSPPEPQAEKRWWSLIRWHR